MLFVVSTLAAFAGCVPPPGVRLAAPTAHWTEAHPTDRPASDDPPPPLPIEIVPSSLPEGPVRIGAGDFIDPVPLDRIRALCRAIGSPADCEPVRLCETPGSCAEALRQVLLASQEAPCAIRAVPAATSRVPAALLPEKRLFDALNTAGLLCSSRWRARASRVAVEAMLFPHLRPTRSPMLSALAREWNGEGVTSEPANTFADRELSLGQATMTETNAAPAGDPLPRRSVGLVPGTMVEIVQAAPLRRQGAMPVEIPPSYSILRIPLRFVPEVARPLQPPLSQFVNGWLAASVGQHEVIADSCGEGVAPASRPYLFPQPIGGEPLSKDLPSQACVCAGGDPSKPRACSALEAGRPSLQEWSYYLRNPLRLRRFWNQLLDPGKGSLALGIATVTADDVDAQPVGKDVPAGGNTQVEANPFAALYGAIERESMARAPAGTGRAAVDLCDAPNPWSAYFKDYCRAVDRLAHTRKSTADGSAPATTVGWRSVAGAVGLPTLEQPASLERTLGVAQTMAIGTGDTASQHFPYDVVPTNDTPSTYVANRTSPGTMIDLQVLAQPGAVRWSNPEYESWSLAEWQASGIYGHVRPRLLSIRWKTKCRLEATDTAKAVALDKSLTTAILWPGDTRAANAEVRVFRQARGKPLAVYLAPRGTGYAKSEGDVCAQLGGVAELARHGRDGILVDYSDLRRLDTPGGNDFARRRCLVARDRDASCGDATSWAFVPFAFDFRGGDDKRRQWRLDDKRDCGKMDWSAQDGLTVGAGTCDATLYERFSSAAAAQAASVSGWELFRIPSPDVEQRIRGIEVPRIGRLEVVDEDGTRHGAEGGICKPSHTLDYARRPWRGALEIVPAAGDRDRHCPPTIASSALWALTSRNVLGVSGMTATPLRGHAGERP